MHWGVLQRCQNVTSGPLRYESDRWRSFSLSSFGLFFFSLVNVIFGMQKLHSVTHRSVVKHKCWETGIVSLTSWSLQPPRWETAGGSQAFNRAILRPRQWHRATAPSTTGAGILGTRQSLEFETSLTPISKSKNILCYILTENLTIASGHPIYPYLCSQTEVQRSNVVTTLQVLNVVQKWLYTEGIHSSE